MRNLGILSVIVNHISNRLLTSIFTITTGLERRKKETVRCDRFPAVGFSPLCSYEPTLQARTKYSKEEGMSPRPEKPLKSTISEVFVYYNANYE